jgi:predicted fused transcriptional regulator/phosphomethylpyrimidine kinase/predicted transcriptional regulator
MLPPCEMMVEFFLPNIRGLVSHELYSRGTSQRKIASFLGVTQARVSNYLSTNRQHYISELGRTFGSSASEIEGYSKILSEEAGRSQSEGIFTLYSIWKNLLFRGNVCAIHREQSGITSECSVCMELHRPLRESETNPENEDTMILRNISEAVSMLENSATFPMLMPEVSVNVAMSKTNPKTISDIAAIPGRLNRIHGRAKAFVLPEFGSSIHMSNVLLMFHSKSSILRSAMNIRFDRHVESALQKLRVPRMFTKEVESSGGRRTTSRETEDPVLQRLRGMTLPSPLETPFAVVDRGSEGVEPNTYLIGKAALEISQTAINISRICLAAKREVQ